MYLKILIINTFLLGITCQVTKIAKPNIFLSRKRRYLMFPEKSNFVVSIVLGKRFMIVQPKGLQLTEECDFPFALPSDTRLFKNKPKNRRREKREIYSEIEEALNRIGFNGSACVNRILCEAHQYLHLNNNSLSQQILSTLFSPEEDFNELNCAEAQFSECEVSFFKHILNSLLVGE